MLTMTKHVLARFKFVKHLGVKGKRGGVVYIRKHIHKNS